MHYIKLGMSEMVIYNLENFYYYHYSNGTTDFYYESIIVTNHSNVYIGKFEVEDAEEPYIDFEEDKRYLINNLIRIHRRIMYC